MTRRIEIGIMLAGLAAFSTLYNTQGILPSLTREYGITPSAAAMSVSIATAGVGAGLILAVPISERIGRVVLIRWSMLASAVIGLIIPFIPDWNMLLAARFVLGLTVAGLPGTATVYLREEINPKIVSGVIGIHVLGNSIGGLAGRLVTTSTLWVMEFFGFDSFFGMGQSHAALFATAILGAACAVSCWLLLPPARGFQPHKDSVGLLARKFGRAFKDPVLLGLYLVGYLGVGAFVGVFNVLGFRLEEAPYFIPVGIMGLLYLVYPLAGSAGAYAGRIADRTSLRSVMIFGPLIGLVGVALLATPWLITIIAGLAVLSIGFFVGHSTASSWVSGRAAVSVGVPAQAASIYMVFFYLGSSVTGNLTPLAWSAAGWWGVTGVIGAHVFLLLVIVVLLSRSRPVSQRTTIGT